MEERLGGVMERNGVVNRIEIHFVHVRSSQIISKVSLHAFQDRVSLCVALGVLKLILWTGLAS